MPQTGFRVFRAPVAALHINLLFLYFHRFLFFSSKNTSRGDLYLLCSASEESKLVLLKLLPPKQLSFDGKMERRLSATVFSAETAATGVAELVVSICKHPGGRCQTSLSRYWIRTSFGDLTWKYVPIVWSTAVAKSLYVASSRHVLSIRYILHRSKFSP